MKTDTIQHDSLADFVPIDEYQTQHSDKLSKTQLKWLARFRDTNGLSECGAIVNVSRKLYVNTKKFPEWFAAQRG
ncbi:MAG: hypothetical protein ACXW1U_16945 [Methylobacter sp.]